MQNSLTPSISKSILFNSISLLFMLYVTTSNATNSTDKKGVHEEGTSTSNKETKTQRKKRLALERKAAETERKNLASTTSTPTESKTQRKKRLALERKAVETERKNLASSQTGQTNLRTARKLFEKPPVTEEARNEAEIVRLEAEVTRLEAEMNEPGPTTTSSLEEKDRKARRASLTIARESLDIVQSSCKRRRSGLPTDNVGDEKGGEAYTEPLLAEPVASDVNALDSYDEMIARLDAKYYSENDADTEEDKKARRASLTIALESLDLARRVNDLTTENADDENTSTTVEAERVRLAAENAEAERVPIVQIAEREEEEQEEQEGWVDLGQHQGLRGAEEIVARNVAPVELAQNEEEEGIPAAAPLAPPAPPVAAPAIIPAAAPPAPPAPPMPVAAAPAIIPAVAPPVAAPAIIPAAAPPAPPAPPVAVAAPAIIPAVAPPVAVAAAPAIIPAAPVAAALVIIPFAVLLPPAVAAVPQYPNLRASSFSEGHSSVVSHLLAAAPGTDLALVMQTLDGLPSLQREDAIERISSTQVTAMPEIVENTGSMVNNLTGVKLSNLRSNTGSSGGQQAANFAAGKGQRSLSILNRLQKQNIDRPQETHHNTRAGLAADFDHQMQQSIALSRGKGGVWAHGFGNIGNQKNQKNQRGFKAETGGFMAGMDYRVSSNVFLGGGLGFSSSDVNWKNSGGKGRIRGYFATFYSTWYQGGFYVNGSLVAGVNCYKVGRHLLLGSVIDRTASNHHKGYEFTPHIGMGYEIPFKSLTLEPFIGLDYSHIHQDGYNETGAKDLNLKVKSQSAEMLRGEAGFNIFKTLPFEGGNWTPKLKLSYILKEPTKKGNMQAALQGQPTFFAVKSFTRTRNQFSPGVGMTFRFNSGVFVDVRYDAELDSSYKAHEVGLKIGYAF